MSRVEHQWDTFYSPRNGRISIQACRVCGVAKGLVLNTHECSKTNNSVKNMRLKGWTTVSRMRQSVNSLEVSERLRA